jgi:hypothetical protein
MRQTVRLLMGYIPGRNLVALALLMFGSGKYRQVLAYHLMTTYRVCRNAGFLRECG